MVNGHAKKPADLHVELLPSIGSEAGGVGCGPEGGSSICSKEAIASRLEAIALRLEACGSICCFKSFLVPASELLTWRSEATR